MKIRGLRIELGEIEAALGRHGAVSRCVVVARQDRGSDARLVAYLTGRTVGTAELRAHLGATLPDYMIPSAFVWLDAIPLTVSGKVDRKALPAPELDRDRLSAHFVAPRTPVEETLAGIWAEVLGAEAVGVHDDFFEIGGDSLMTLVVANRASRVGLRLDARQISEAPTIAALASRVATAEAPPDTGDAPVRGEAPPTAIQRWFFAQGFAAPDHWNQAVCVPVPASHDAAVVEAALQLVINRHDALRLGFDGERPVYGPDSGPFTVERLDVAHLAAELRDARIDAAASALHARMRLVTPPLVRALHIDRGEEGLRVVIVIHNLVVDAVSWRILLDDFARTCAAIAEGRPPRLGPRGIPWQRWAEAQAALADSERLRAQRPYWRRVITAPVTPLPTRAAPSATAGRHTMTVALDAEHTRTLVRRGGRTHGADPRALLLAGLAGALRRWTGGETIGLVLEGHGRAADVADLDLSRTVGWFSSLFPVRVDLSDVPASRQALDPLIAAAQRCLRGLPDDGVGHGILRWLGDGGADLALPARGFDVAFNYLGRLRSDQGGLGADAGPTGQWRAARNGSAWPLVIDALALDGRLQLRLDWDGQALDPASVQAFAADLAQTLEDIARHRRAALDARATAPMPAAVAPTTRRLEADGLALCALEWGDPAGDGPDVLCLHGRLDHAGSWSVIGEALAAGGARVLAPDLRGHGHSAHAPGYGWDGFLVDAHAALSALRPGPVFVVGHSLGAGLAITLARLVPERIAGLVLVEPDFHLVSADPLAAWRARLGGGQTQHPVHRPIESTAQALDRARRALPGVSEASIAARVERLTRRDADGTRWRWDPRLLAEQYPGVPDRGTFVRLVEGITAPTDWLYGAGRSALDDADIAALRGIGPHVVEHRLPGDHIVHLQHPEAVARIVTQRVFGPDDLTRPMGGGVSHPTATRGVRHGIR